jgi:hypothetical protein
VHTVDLEEHHYWTIARELRVNKYDPPQELTVGQLAEDWDSLQHSLAAEGPPIGYALVWFAEILREVGETHPA